MDRAPAPNPDWDAARPSPAQSSAPFRVYNIGGGRPVKVSRLVEVLEAALGRKAKKRTLPMQQGDVAATHADTGALQRDTELCADDVDRGGRTSICPLVPRVLRRLGGLRRDPEIFVLVQNGFGRKLRVLMGLEDADRPVFDVTVFVEADDPLQGLDRPGLNGVAHRRAGHRCTRLGDPLDCVERHLHRVIGGDRVG